MTMEERYARWLEKTKDNEELHAQLLSYDEKEKVESFFKDLEFGTGGLRGKIGAGPNKMNIYTVGRATQGLAETIGAGSKVAIAYDSRNKSDVFAKTAAGVFAANGVKAYIFPRLMPTPTLSYAVRALGCDAGVVVTASHNPAIYNGYKAYGSDGCQFTLELAEKTLERILATDEFDGVKKMDFEQGLKEGKIEYIGEETYQGFLDAVCAQTLQPGLCKEVGLKVVYTPLNGTGNRPVRDALARLGVDVSVVKEQENPDGNFPTCPYPNPEEKVNFKLAEELALQLQPDLLLGTDPDCDRVGIAGRNRDGSFTLMTGNEVGLMLMEYVLSTRKAQGTLPEKPVVIKTIVTADLAQEIAEAYGAEIINVLTGFKFIGEQMTELVNKGEGDRFIIGFEESYGYLGGLYARDKDAVFASVMICEMAADLKKKGMTIPEFMESIYEKYGYCLHELKNYAFEGKAGMEKMKRIMQSFREDKAGFAGEKLVRFSDYKASEAVDVATGEKTVLTLPKSDVLCFELTGGLKFLVRPSGTEPKMKAYLVAKAKTREAAQAGIARLGDAVTAKIDSVE